MSRSKFPPGDGGAPSSDDDDAGYVSDAVARAEAVVAAFADEYLNWLSTDLDRVDELLASAQGNPQSVQQLRRKAHDIRGQGGSFGFPLVTKLAEALHKVVAAQQGCLDAKGVALAGRVAHAMRMVVEHRARGDGDEQTRAIVESAVRSVSEDIGEA